MGYLQQLERLRKRDAGLYKMHLDFPQVSVRALGRIYKLSPGRISQILKAQRGAVK